jgi:hypothetical protein
MGFESLLEGRGLGRNRVRICTMSVGNGTKAYASPHILTLFYDMLTMWRGISSSSSTINKMYLLYIHNVSGES